MTLNALYGCFFACLFTHKDEGTTEKLRDLSSVFKDKKKRNVLLLRCSFQYFYVLVYDTKEEV